MGAIGIASVPSIWLAGALASAGEPHETLATYFASSATMAVFLAVFVSPIVVALLAGVVRVARESSRDPLFEARLRAWVLAPILAVLPMTVWCVASMIVDVRDPSFGLGVGIKPAWIYSPLFTILGFKLWPFFLLFALLVIANRIAARAASLLPGASACSNCAYDLRGLSGSICPECGTDVMTQEATTRLDISSKNPF